MIKGRIYALIDPRDNLVKYIGKTKTIGNKRYNQHLVDWKRRTSKSCSWIKHLLSINLKPIEEIIEENISEQELNSKEIKYIALFKACGANLKNHTIGGEGHNGQKMSEKSKIKRKETNKNSIKMVQKHKEHSEFMKNKVKEGKWVNPLIYSTPDKIQNGRIKRIESLKITRINKPEKFEEGYKKVRKPIISMDIEGNELIVFDSVKSAGEFYNIASTNITGVCKGRYKQMKGYTFKYKNDDKSLNRKIAKKQKVS